jgi:hypothetical protein
MSQPTDERSVQNERATTPLPPPPTDVEHRLAREFARLLVGRGVGGGEKAMTSMEVICCAMDVVQRLCCDVTGMEKACIARALLDTLLSGADGVMGTADDLIPPGTLQNLRALVSSGTLSELMHTLVAVARGSMLRSIANDWMKKRGSCQSFFLLRLCRWPKNESRGRRPSVIVGAPNNTNLQKPLL